MAPPLPPLIEPKKGGLMALTKAISEILIFCTCSIDELD